jgi:MarR-like DNA-binding transcriptional regulator SgrR of sgrS sRNA
VLSVKDVAERSRQKSEMLQGYGDAVLRAETLEEQLVKSRKHATAMQSKLDTVGVLDWQPTTGSTRSR